MENKQEKDNLLFYINENFNVDATTIRLINSLYDYFNNNNNSLNIINYNQCRIAIHSFLYTLLDILNDADIDLTMEELLDNNIINTECR